MYFMANSVTYFLIKSVYLSTTCILCSIFKDQLQRILIGIAESADSFGGNNLCESSIDYILTTETHVCKREGGGN